MILKAPSVFASLRSNMRTSRRRARSRCCTWPASAGRLRLPRARRSRKRRLELSRCDGAELLELLAEETQSELGSWDRARADTGELSPAERRVLRLLMTRLTQREIANELYVSLNTVKTHARVIYRKLGVGSRTAAVAVARELNLV